MDITSRCKEIVESAGEVSETQRLADFMDATWEYQMTEHPEFATYTGFPGQNHRWSDQTLEAIERRKAELTPQLEALRSIDPDGLGEDDQLNYDLLLRSINEDIEGSRFPQELLPLGPMGGPHSGVARVIEMTPSAKTADLENVLERLRGIPKVIDESIALMGEGIARGIVPPQIVLRGAADQISTMIVDDPAESSLLKALNSGSIEAAPYADDAAKIYRSDIAPALQKLRDFVSETYVPEARDSIAISDLPDGADWYEFAVRKHTTTDMAPKEVHEIGLSEVERIRGLMDETIAKAGFEGTFGDFAEFLRSDSQFYFDDPEELLKAYRDISKRADPELAPLFGRLPGLPYGVRPVPEYIEQTTTTAYYQPGSPEAGRAGYFYANTYDLSSRPSWEMEALTLHEAVPGHHLQIAIAQELDLPNFRRWHFHTAYVEGWGLYSESLGEEMGFYQDPYSRFGQLTYEMWRSIRLVVDTGMHALGWTRDQAIEFFKANAGKAEHDIVVEVDRYIFWPGQALGYKIGELKLKELRAYATEQLGESFDLRGFHDEILGQASLPLDILEPRIRAWVEAERRLHR